MFGEELQRVREKSVLIHNMTNSVTINDVANAQLAIGSSPIMASGIDAIEITERSDGLNINTGMYDGNEWLIEVGRRSVELGHPTVLDPVGIGASNIRTQGLLELVDEVKFTAINGNVSEIKNLVGLSAKTQGVDAYAGDLLDEKNMEKYRAVFENYASKRGLILVMTGPIDLITDGRETFLIKNGRAEMTSVTGLGCQVSGLISAFLAANPQSPLRAAAAAVATMGVAGEIAWEHMAAEDGNATYRNRIIDAIYHMTPEILEGEVNYVLL